NAQTPSQFKTLSLHDALPISVKHEKVHRLRHAEKLNQQVLATFVRHQAEAKCTAADSCIFRGDPKIARKSQRHTRLDSEAIDRGDRKSTRLNSSHVSISYAVF